MPRKVRQLLADYRRAGFMIVASGGKGGKPQAKRFHQGRARKPLTSVMGRKRRPKRY